MKNLFGIFLFLVSSFAFSQDAFFTQYNNARLNTNPAFSGIDSTMVISTGYRLQWPNISSPYQTFYFSTDKYIRSIRAGVGFNYLNDYQMNGAFVKNRFELNYAPHVELFKHKLVLIPALQLSYFQNKLDFSKLTFGDQIDDRRGFVYNTNEASGVNTKSGTDLSLGFMIYSENFWTGITIHHINQPDEGFFSKSKLPVKISVHGGLNLKFKKDTLNNFVLSPTLLYMKQQHFEMLMPGIAVKYKFLSIGISYRNKDAFITTLAIQNKILRVGYSYDYTVSMLDNKNTGGSHEIGVGYFLNFKRKLCKIKTLRMI